LKNTSLLAALLAALVTSAGAGAAERVEKPAPTWLLQRFGVSAAEKLLQSDTSADRQRALARLSSSGTPRAVELLAKALDPGGAARGAQEHLAAVRALAPHAKLPLARDALVRALASPSATGASGPLAEWVRTASALALARTQDPAALAALGRALRKPGAPARAAQEALLDVPPRDLEPILRAPGAATRELCETLGKLGDLRAEAALRDVVRRGAPEARAAAAVALWRLGSLEVVELAEHWLRSERQPALLEATAAILLEARSPQAPRALELLVSAGQHGSALELLLRTDGSLDAPRELWSSASSLSSGPLLEVLARGFGSQPQRTALERALAAPHSASLAIFALSQAPGSAAKARLALALTEPRLQAHALRALALRSRQFDESPEPLVERAEQLLRSADASQRAAGAFALALLEPERLPALLGSRDALVVRAAARVAFTGTAAQHAVERLQRERAGLTRTALAIGLSDATAAARVPTPLLVELVHEPDGAAPLALLALSARRDAEVLPLLREKLGSPDPWLRAHALLGLGRATEPDALGMIENAYRFEPDASVRHAAIVALSARPEPTRARTLSLAAELDEAQAVREAARRALAGKRLSPTLSGRSSFWLQAARREGLADGAVPLAAVRIGHGLSLPLVADPDGVVALWGLDSAPVEPRLALGAERVNGSTSAR
jgi:HEAT repeat protein